MLCPPRRCKSGSTEPGERALTKVVANNNESAEQLIRRFRKVVTRSGLLGEVRSRRWFVSKSELKRMEKKKAIRRAKRPPKTETYR